MAEEEQKTLDPTHKKLEDARKRGDVPSAPEMRHAAMFAAMVLIVGALGAAAAARLAAQTEALWEGAGDLALTSGNTQRLARTLLGGILVAVGPILLLTLVAAVAGAMLQGRSLFLSGQLKLKWDRLSPMAGAERPIPGVGRSDARSPARRCQSTGSFRGPASGRNPGCAHRFPRFPVPAKGSPRYSPPSIRNRTAGHRR